jgi:hypothetical protein
MNARTAQVKRLAARCGTGQVSMSATSQSPPTFSMVTVTQFL